MPETRSLHRKLAQVMYEAERIPKNGTAPREMGGYKFVQVGDAADYIRKALAEKVLTMMPIGVSVVGQVDRPTKSGGTMTTLDIVTTWRISDGESGEFIDLQAFGAGADTGDKYSGKAMTNAMKYALLAGFLLSTGDDVEQHGLQAVQEGDDKKAETDGLIGIATTQGTQDGELRQTPDGFILPFRVKDDGKSFIVMAHDALAETLATMRQTWMGGRVTVWGSWEDKEIPAKGTKPAIRYRVLNLERIATADWTLPAQTSADIERADPVLFATAPDDTGAK